ncbi:MAG: outer membrane lipoprotein chaperone LolA [Acidobacteria bacterium]|nr:outer membrane lipoprotein chaperone LolA [Acidobacteriota bacterium]
MIALLAVAAFAQAVSKPDAALLKSIEDRYNRAESLRVRFEQTYSGQGPGRRTESGTLLLRKPGRMRWDYDRPPGKLFLSDGGMAWFYTPSTNRAEKGKIKESEDLRAPLAFLLGRVDFKRDFKGATVDRGTGHPVVRALAKSENAPYERVEFTAGEAGMIEALTVFGRDGSVMTFRFQGEETNPKLDRALFRFVPPPGVEVVDSDQERR